MKLQYLILAVFFILGSCRDQKLDIDSLKVKYRNAPFLLTANDSLVILQHPVYKGDFGSYHAYKMAHRRKAIAMSSWARAANYLGIPEQEAKQYSTSLGFDSSFYFIKFLGDSTVSHPVKTKLMSDLRNRIRVSTSDSIVGKLNDRRLLEYSFAVNTRQEREASLQNSLKHNLERFHDVMAKAYHAYRDSSDVKVARTLAFDIVLASERCLLSTVPPLDEDTKNMLQQLKLDSSGLKNLVEAEASDSAIEASLIKVRDTFYKIANKVD